MEPWSLLCGYIKVEMDFLLRYNELSIEISEKVKIEMTGIDERVIQHDMGYS